MDTIALVVGGFGAFGARLIAAVITACIGDLCTLFKSWYQPDYGDQLDGQAERKTQLDQSDL